MAQQVNTWANMAPPQANVPYDQMTPEMKAQLFASFQPPSGVPTQANLSVQNEQANNPPPPPPTQQSRDEDSATIQDLIGQIQARNIQSLGDERKGIEGLEKQADAYSQLGGQLDLSPLLALSDSWYGGNLAKGYAKPESGRDRAGTMANLQLAIQKARGGLSGNELQFLKDQLGNKFKEKELESTSLDKRLKQQQISLLNDQQKDYKNQKMTTQDREKWQKETGKKLEAFTVFKENLVEFQDLLHKHGGQPPLNHPDWARVDSLYQNMTLPWKETGELGALSGPDVGIIKGALGPQSFTDWVKQGLTKGGAEGVFGNLNAMSQNTDKVFRRTKDKGTKVYPIEHVKDLADQAEQEFSSIGGGGGGAGAPPIDQSAVNAELIRRGLKK